MGAERGFILHLLGPFRLLDSEGRRIAIPSKRGMALLALLAAGNGERTRTWLQEKLWGSRDEAQAQGSLRRELSTLRALIADAGGDFLHADHQRVWLDLSRLRIDLETGADGGTTDEFLEGLDLHGEEGFEEWLRERRSAYAARQPDTRPVRASAAWPGGTEELRKPTVAVMAFANSAGDPVRDDLVAGLGDEIAVTLSRFGTLCVLAAEPRASVLDEGSPSKARFLLHGRASMAGDHLRLWLKLIDGRDGLQLWSERFDDTLENAFDVQEKLALAVARRVDSAIEKEEMRRALARPGDEDAGALYWRANASFRRWTPTTVRQAAELCERVQRLATGNPWPFALSAFCRATLFATGWTTDAAADRTRALEDAGVALQLGSDDPSTLGYVAGALLVAGGDIEQARRAVDRACSLGSGYPSLPFWRGWIDLCLGDPEQGLQQLTAAAEINPRSAVRPFQQAGIGLCRLLLGHYTDAIPPLEDAVHCMPDNPIALAGLAAALARAGQFDQATLMAERLRRADPPLLTPSLLREPAQRALWAEGIELALSGGPPPPLRLIGGARAGAT